MAERFKRLTVNQDHAGSSPVGYAITGCYTVSGSWAVCKTVVFDSGGSTPSHPTFICFCSSKVKQGICNPQFTVQVCAGALRVDSVQIR